MLVARDKKIVVLFALMSIAYLALSVLITPDKTTSSRYHITSGQDAALTFTVTIPMIIIWVIALAGYLRLENYTNTIKRGKDGAAFRVISRGVLLLALWLPVTSLTGTILNSLARSHLSAAGVFVNINNYINILLLMGAFWFIFKGSESLLKVVKKANARLPLSVSTLFIAFSSFYVFLVLQDRARQFPTHGVTLAAYYLPDWLTILLIVIPRLFTWYLGVQAVYNIYLYRRNVKGQIYTRALNDLVFGLGWVIVMSIILRGFQSLSRQLTDLSLGVILLLVYVLLALIAGGFWMIAKGARRLQKIEEI